MRRKKLRKGRVMFLIIVLLIIIFTIFYFTLFNQADKYTKTFLSECTREELNTAVITTGKSDNDKVGLEKDGEWEEPISTLDRRILSIIEAAANGKNIIYVPIQRAGHEVKKEEIIELVDVLKKKFPDREFSFTKATFHDYYGEEYTADAVCIKNRKQNND